MKAITIWEPWASLLVSGAKVCETRGWRSQHRGPLLIHAGKKWSAELASLSAREPFASALAEMGIAGHGGFHLGCIIGMVDVVHVFPTESARTAEVNHACMGHSGGPTLFEAEERLFITRAERSFGDFSPGRYAMYCTNPVRFKKPIPYAGGMMVYDVALSDEVIAEARAAAGASSAGLFNRG